MQSLSQTSSNGYEDGRVITKTETSRYRESPNPKVKNGNISIFERVDTKESNLPSLQPIEHNYIGHQVNKKSDNRYSVHTNNGKIVLPKSVNSQANAPRASQSVQQLPIKLNLNFVPKRESINGSQKSMSRKRIKKKEYEGTAKYSNKQKLREKN